MPLSYEQAGLLLRRGGDNDRALVRDLQADLRALGYLRSGIDGDFGDGTEAAVRALQFDLLHNAGRSTEQPQGPPRAPVAIRDFNGRGTGGPIAAVDGVVDQRLAGSIGALLADHAVPKLPFSERPDTDNRAAVAAIATMGTSAAPPPFMVAMFRQESNGQHYRVPGIRDADAFVTVGLDRNAPDSNKDHITSRGYGIGQYTLFHHPPQPGEVQDFILDPHRNVERAFAEFREKFDHFVIAPGGRGADDHQAEHAIRPLTPCKFPQGDARFMRDCRNCALGVRKLQIRSGMPYYAGSPDTWQATQYYARAEYDNVPDRAEFGCDWPYAARRYNGSGPNSFHYQARILRNLLLPVDDA